MTKSELVALAIACPSYSELVAALNASGVLWRKISERGKASGETEMLPAMLSYSYDDRKGWGSRYLRCVAKVGEEFRYEGVDGWVLVGNYHVPGDVFSHDQHLVILAKV